MSQDINAIPPFSGAKLKDVHESLGITQLTVGGVATAWYQTIGGLLFQGNYFEIDHDTTINVPFVVVYTKIVLWVGLTVVSSNPGDAGAIPRWVGTDANFTYFQVDWAREAGTQGTIGVMWLAVGV